MRLCIGLQMSVMQILGRSRLREVLGSMMPDMKRVDAWPLNVAIEIIVSD